tara:strand:+ start:69842 stop:71206 length:1365 start_codon:yes stop_codon:yes gene_type:complete
MKENINKLKEIAKEKLEFLKLRPYENEVLAISSNSINYSEEVESCFYKIFENLNIDESIKKLYEGKIVNITESRPALHHTYRKNKKEFIKDINELEDYINSKGYKTLISLGIGGSYEGPNLLNEFFSTMKAQKYKRISILGPDEEEFRFKMQSVNLNESCFIVSSKSLSTIETLNSYDLAKKLLADNGITDKKIKDHFMTITSDEHKAKKLGFNNTNTLLFPESVGGRYSIWSPISYISALENQEYFLDFLEGGKLVDNLLFSDKDFYDSLKRICFLDLWNSNFLNKETRLIFSYSWPLRSIPSYFQQLEMESLGKRPSKKSYFSKTGQTIFGGFGPKAQHSLFQHVHQGTAQLCVDLISMSASGGDKAINQHQANAQISLFSSNRKKFKNKKYQVNGDIPNTHWLLKEKSGKSLGFLIAFWELRVFINACMLQINPFDQFGVEAGKELTDSKI